MDAWWLVGLKIVAVFGFLLVMTIFVIVFERKVVARMQVRPGPNRAGPNGWLQSLADGLKLILKEDITPVRADRVVHALAPVIAVACALTAFAVVPFGPTASVFGQRMTLQLADPPVGVLVALACSALGVYGVVLSGWAAGSTYPLLGGLRSAAQIISYEIVMGLSIAGVLLLSGSLRTSDIVARQAHGWYLILLLPSFLSYFFSSVGETNRAPFDLAEAESELVGGFHTEYSSVKFMLLYLAEYVNVISLCGLCVTMFLGGWRVPWPLSAIGGGTLNQGWWPPLSFLLKLVVLLFVFVWLRGTLPRVRYDRYMQFSWKVLIPANLVWILLVAGARVSGSAPVAVRWMIGGGFVLIGLLIVLAWPRRNRHTGPRPEPRPVDGGFPVPPLDLVVPVNPRAARMTGERMSAGVAEPRPDAVEQPR
jgi:NADH-quinone oxidoreductase subunit H